MTGLSQALEDEQAKESGCVVARRMAQMEPDDAAALVKRLSENEMSIAAIQRAMKRSGMEAGKATLSAHRRFLQGEKEGACECR